MQEENDDDERHDEHFFGEFLSERRYRSMDKRRAIIRLDNLNTFRQSAA